MSAAAAAPGRARAGALRRACSPRARGRMRSSVMRDLMAITERPEVISLAGGLPDTSTVRAARCSPRLMAASPPARARPSSTGRPRASPASASAIVE